jgi:hypothetical protein
MTELEEDFELINNYIKEAAINLGLASRLSQKIGLNGALIHTQYTEDLDLDIDEAIYDLEGTIVAMFKHIDVSLLESALEDAGWSTSSSYC